jgi:hypothetical protein
MELVWMRVKYLGHLHLPMDTILVDVEIGTIATDEVTKVMEVRTATEEEVVAMYVSRSTTKVLPVEQTSSLICLATVVGRTQIAPIANV